MATFVPALQSPCFGKGRRVWGQRGVVALGPLGFSFSLPSRTGYSVPLDDFTLTCAYSVTVFVAHGSGLIRVKMPEKA